MKADLLALIAIVLLFASAVLWKVEQTRMEQVTSCLYQQHAVENTLEACRKIGPYNKIR
ncbi:MAG: hypothetical protein JSV66_04720 [Trueperaceae bacterium]|nr:MAG: hypothetical protein JSV66_04720 [Trueperaceae bacterium]